MSTTSITYPPGFVALRWRVFLLLSLCYMTVYFHRMAPGVVAGDLMQSFQISGAELGSLAAMYYYIYTAMQIPSGVLADTLGVRVVVSIGGVIAGLGSILFGLASTLDGCAAGRFLVGLGVSVVFVGMMKSNSVWFTAGQYARISGLTVLLGNAGAILGAGPLAVLLTLVSWRAAFVGIGILSLLLAVLAAIWLRDGPQQAGYPSVRELQGLPPFPAREHHWLHELWQVILNRDIWPAFWVVFGAGGTLFSFAGLWGVPLMQDVHGLERGAASLYTTVMLLGMALGSFFWGWLSDVRRERLAVLKTALILTTGLWLVLLTVPWGAGASGMWLYFLLGFCGSGFILCFTIAKECVSPAVAGMGIALVNTGLFLGAALAQPGFGWMLDQAASPLAGAMHPVFSWVDYQRGLLLYLAFSILALAAAMRMRIAHQAAPPRH